MGISGGDPAALAGASTSLGDVSTDLAGDACTVAGLGKQAAGAAPGRVGHLADTALAAIGGALTAAATLAEGLSQGASTAGDQLVKATGGR